MISQNTSALPDMLQLRRKVRTIVVRYHNAGIAWRISGWYKPSIKSMDEQVMFLPNAY